MQLAKAMTVVITATMVIGAHSRKCESYCASPCSELNGDVAVECGACAPERGGCNPFTTGFPQKVQLTVESSGSSSNGERLPSFAPAQRVAIEHVTISKRGPTDHDKNEFSALRGLATHQLFPTFVSTTHVNDTSLLDQLEDAVHINVAQMKREKGKFENHDFYEWQAQRGASWDPPAVVRLKKLARYACAEHLLDSSYQGYPPQYREFFETRELYLWAALYACPHARCMLCTHYTATTQLSARCCYPTRPCTAGIRQAVAAMVSTTTAAAYALVSSTSLCHRARRRSSSSTRGMRVLASRPTTPTISRPSSRTATMTRGTWQRLTYPFGTVTTRAAPLAHGASSRPLAATWCSSRRG